MDKIFFESNSLYVRHLITNDPPEGLAVTVYRDIEHREFGVDPNQFFTAVVEGLVVYGTAEALRFIFKKTVSAAKRAGTWIKINGKEIPPDKFSDEHEFVRFVMGTEDTEII